jgi:hypothetical protein
MSTDPTPIDVASTVTAPTTAEQATEAVAEEGSIDAIAATITGSTVAEVTAAFDAAVKAATPKGKAGPHKGDAEVLRGALDAAAAALTERPAAKAAKARKEVAPKVEPTPAPEGFHMVPLRTAKHTALIEPLTKGTGSKIAAGNALHVKDADPQRLVNRLVQSYDDSEAQFDRRLLLATTVMVRNVYPEVSVESGSQVHRLIDALNADGSVDWEIGMASDSTLVWTVNGEEGKTTDFAPKYVPKAEKAAKAPKAAKAKIVKVDPEKVAS